MLASSGMRLARELRSPLIPALALSAAALFASRDPGDASLPWLGLAALVLAGRAVRDPEPSGGAIVLLPLVAFGGLVRPLDHLVDRA